MKCVEMPPSHQQKYFQLSKRTNLDRFDIAYEEKIKECELLSKNPFSRT
jgi:hypothetical protein